MGYPVISGGSNPAALSLNFLSGAMDPRITFTRASTATYTDVMGTIQTAAINVPRFDFDPATHRPRGLLIEGARTNQLLNSGAPATQTTASLATGTYTLWMDGTGSAAVTAGTATLTGAGTASSGVVNTFVVTVAGTVTVTVTGSPTRFQLENSAGRSSYIPTVGSVVTRAGDSAILALGSWYNSQACTIVSKVMPYYTPSDGSLLWSVDDNSDANRFFLFASGGTSVVNGYVSVSSVFNVSGVGAASLVALSVLKTAVAVQSTDFSFYASGAQVGSQTTGVIMPTGLVQLVIGGHLGTSIEINGTVQSVDLYNIRLPNGTLAALTT